MKRVHVENWSSKEKLALASSVLRSGDQNWMSVSRLIRVFGESNRPPDWFSQKQCAVQYDVLLNTVSTQKRKKRSEKGLDTSVDTPGESVVRKLTQERIEELKLLLMEGRVQYLKEKLELEDINNGRLDDRLGEIMQQMEQSDANDKEELAAQGALRQWEERKLEHERPPPPPYSSSVRNKIENICSDVVPMQVEVKPTSPLLTSLLQSPSPVMMHRNAGPTISSLLHSAPAVPRSPQPLPLQQLAPTTLSKLLESPTIAASSLAEPSVPSTSPRAAAAATATSTSHALPSEVLAEPFKEVEIKIEVDDSGDTSFIENVTSDVIANTEPAEVVVTASESEVIASPTKSLLSSPIKVEQQLPVAQSTPPISAPADEGSSVVSVHSQSADSDLIAESLSELAELDSHTVEMIVVGPTQSGLVAVKEELVEITSTDIALATEDKLEMMAPTEPDVIEEAIIPSETVKMEAVKDLGEVTASEMKEIIEGAEVIVEGLADNEAKGARVSAKADEAAAADDRHAAISTTTQLAVVRPRVAAADDAPSAAEEAADEETVDGSVIVDNIVEFDDAIVEVSEAETTQDTIVSERRAAEELEEPLAKPDSSSAVETDTDRSVATDVSEAFAVQQQMEASPLAEKLPDVLEEMIRESTVTSTATEMTASPMVMSSSALATPASTLPPHIPVLAPETVSTSRPDTPSTEEDNEPVANLVKKMASKKPSLLASAVLPSDPVPNSPSATTEDGASLRAWKKSIMLVYNRLAAHKYASLFLRPITNEQARGYHGVIHRPMDLSTIKRNVETGVLRTTVEFQRDMMLMFQNAIMYNNSTTLVYEMASEMQNECIQHIQLMVEAMGEGVPLRREDVDLDSAKNTRGARGKSDKEQARVVKQGEKPEHELVPRKRKRMSVLASDSPQLKKRKAEEV